MSALVAIPTTQTTIHPTAGSEEILTVLAGLFMLLVAAKVGEELARRLGQPGVVGELAGGFLVGPYALGLVQPGETAAVFSEIGVILLLFSVGLEVRFDDLLAVGRPSAVTAVIGVVLPILAGGAVGLAVDGDVGTSALIGLALAATSIGITSKVLVDLGVLDRPYSRIILGAAVIDDILALILIGVVEGAAGGDASTSILPLIVGALGFVGVGLLTARRARGIPREMFTRPRFAETPLVPAFIAMLGLALVAVWIGLAAIIGAFVAGLIIAETGARHDVEEEIRPLASIFTPFFFAVTGAQVDLGALLDARIAAIALVLAVLGVGTKWIAGAIGAREVGRWGATAVGIGMVPRGEVGIIVANLGLAAGLLPEDLFSATLVAVVLTTVVAPYLLQWAIPRARAEGEREASTAVA